ncbi:MAG TPA: RNA polymerase sigma factor [Streptosporangiaceae bacterium]|jgi:RNA polymerase sigma-70 factor (ECF subfamily)|nr:RNA polymerase sigma factor [Streptosporangiaceae bacterium]
MTAVPSSASVPVAGPRPASEQERADARIVQASLTDPDRFGVIFDRYFAEIHGYVARRLGSDVADDVAAETFATAFGDRRRFDASRGAVRAWLYGIATNHVGRHRRREVREYRAIRRTGEAPAEEGPADRVAAQVSAGAMRGRLAGALAGLSAADRDVLLLIALAGLSHAEVAAALGIPYGTVGSRLSRVRRKLRDQLGDTARPELD